MRLELAIPYKNRINISSPSNPDPRKIKFFSGYGLRKVPDFSKKSAEHHALARREYHGHF
jgi:hypothetical protein